MKHTDLAPIYLTPLKEQKRSFIKFIGSGTGLGKTYGSFSAFNQYSQYLDSKKGAKEDRVVGIFAAPQHNQISFNSTIEKKLSRLGCSVFKVEPLSYDLLGDIERSPNALDIANLLFFESSTPWKTNKLYDYVLEAAEKTDIKTAGSTQRTDIKSQVEGMRWGVCKINRYQGKMVDKLVPSSAGTEEVSIEERIQNDDLATAKEELRAKIKDEGRALARNLIKFFETYYTKNEFRSYLEKTCSKQGMNKIAKQASSFFPFLEYQVSGLPSTLMGMTISKLLVNQKIFYPRLIKKTNTLTWTTKSLKISDFISDISAISKDIKSILDEADASNAICYNTSPRKLFDAEFVLYIDESDESKRVIKDELKHDQYDALLIQALGSLAKEIGDVLYDPDYQSLIDQIPDTDRKLFDFLYSGINDDNLKRRAGKEILRRVQDTILEHIVRNNGESDGIASDANTLFKRTSSLAMATLKAPYCTVDDSIDRKVFEITSVFGGENFGFIGSRKVDDLVVMMKENSLCITKKDNAIPGIPSVSLSDFFALITTSWFLFRIIMKHRGENQSKKEKVISYQKKESRFDKKLAAIKNAAALSERGETKAVNDFKKIIKGLPKDSSDALNSVTSPFHAVERVDSKGNLNSYHTKAAALSIRGAHKITQNFFSGAFSPTDSDIQSLIGDKSENFTTTLVSPVDMHYSYERGHTIYGMVQVENEDYEIDQEQKAHVSFPVKIRKSSAEAFLVSLLDNNTRRVSCFLMSATGSFINSHIPAWSMGAIKTLSKGRNFDVLQMTPEDYEITFKKQEERGRLKDISFNVLDEVCDRGFSEALIKLSKAYVKRCEDDITNKSIYNRLSAFFRNPHKITEGRNILKAISHTHHQQGDVPSYCLSLAQTHNGASNILKLLSYEGYPSFYVEGKSYSMTCLLNSGNSPDESARGAGYGIYLLTSSKSSSSRFGRRKSGRDTIIVCYSTSLDNKLKKIFKEKSSNPYSEGYKLKKTIGMDTDRPLKDADSKDFNPMDYILNDSVNHNVVIVSAYNSAARGVNFIVNKETDYLKKKKSSKKRKSKDDNGKSRDNFIQRFERDIQNGQEPSDVKDKRSNKDNFMVERDIDTLFIAVPPYYSEVKTDVDESLNSEKAQKRFFDQCEKYFHYIEWRAREAENGGIRLSNTDVDLQSIYDDPRSDWYFDNQHNISLMSLLMQGLGRIERTNARQEQFIYYSQETGEVIKKGIASITENLDDEDINKTIGAMSVINNKLFHEVMDGSIEISSHNNLNTSSVIDSVYRFELRKKLFLDAIGMYRKYPSLEAIPERIIQQVEFYDSFRSDLLFSEGYEAYMKSLERLVNNMSGRLQRRYQDIVDMMFQVYDTPIDTYFGENNRPIDLKERYEELIMAKSNPFEIIAEGKYIYPSPCFVNDMYGNYGEYMIQLAIDELLSHGKINQLHHKTSNIARMCYEFGDFFLVSGNTMVVIDGKHFRSRFPFVTNSHSDHKRNEKLMMSARDKLKRIEMISGYENVSYVVMNASRRSADGAAGMKKIGPDCYSLHTNSDVETIKKIISHLFGKKKGA